ncbi:exosortase [Sphingomonas sp. Ag1]|jgi:exosortase|uniref:exosortase n=1 Tax=Sphingomonas sp. Ag1 TaxID=1642949 RepID=UPI00069712E3|nr:exosortase [Sphingomonas sp. Ag1]
MIADRGIFRTKEIEVPVTTALNASRGSQPRIVGALRERAAAEWMLLAGITALVVPTLFRMSQWSWSKEAGAHGPIVLATTVWLVWREKDHLREGIRQPLWPGILPLSIALPLYAVGRITSILVLESLSLYLMLLTLAYLRYGGRVLRHFWFPCLYLLFLITPPENWIFVATRPLKMALSDAAVAILATTGMAVGSTGSLIQVEGYQLQVAAACSGLNSLIGIGATSLFYVYLRHGSEPFYALMLVVMMVPIALLTNLLRIMGMVYATQLFGPGVVEGLTHEFAGIGTFALALLVLVGVDFMLFPMARRLGWARG